MRLGLASVSVRFPRPVSPCLWLPARRRERDRVKRGRCLSAYPIHSLSAKGETAGWVAVPAVDRWEAVLSVTHQEGGPARADSDERVLSHQRPDLSMIIVLAYWVIVRVGGILPCISAMPRRLAWPRAGRGRHLAGGKGRWLVVADGMVVLWILGHVVDWVDVRAGK